MKHELKLYGAEWCETCRFIKKKLEDNNIPFEYVNIEKIALIKSKMEDWTDCPCDHFNPHRYCGSKLCRRSVITDGHCHCNLYLRRKDETK